MSISWFALLLLVALVMGGIVLVATLLVSERGRTVLKVLLIVPALVLVVAFLTVFGWRMTSVARHQAALARAEVGQALDSAKRLEMERAPIARVSGTVVCNGEPIAEGDITFRPPGNVSTAPIEGRVFHSAEAKITQGKYVVPEIAAGTYRVEITATRPTGDALLGPDGDEIAEMEQYLPPRYNVESELLVDVRLRSNIFDFDLAVDADEEPAEAEETKLAMADEAKPEASEPAEEAEASGEPATTSGEPSEKTVSETAPPAPTEDRPDWVEAAPHKVDGAYRMSVTVGPFSDRLECDRELPKHLQAAIADYVTTYIGPRARSHVRLPLDYIKSQIVQEEWEEPKQTLITPKGQIPERHVPMLQLHVLLEFDHAVNARVEEEWEKVLVAERLYGVGVLSAIVLGLLAAAYSYLKIDLATGGAYRGRLRLAAVGLLVLLVVGGLWLCMRVAHVATVPSA